MRLAALYWEAGELRQPEQVHETHTHHHVTPLVRGASNRLAHVRLDGAATGSATDVELTIQQDTHGEIELLYRPLRKKR